MHCSRTAVQKIGGQQGGFDVPLGILQEIKVQRGALFFVQALAAQRGDPPPDTAGVVGQAPGHLLVGAPQQPRKHPHRVAQER